MRVTNAVIHFHMLDNLNVIHFVNPRVYQNLSFSSMDLADAHH